MREKPNEEQKPWNPSKVQCDSCKDIIWSKYPGQYVECKCGECFVDQTRYYARWGGKMTLVEQGTNENE